MFSGFLRNFESHASLLWRFCNDFFFVIHKLIASLFTDFWYRYFIFMFGKIFYFRKSWRGRSSPFGIICWNGFVVQTDNVKKLFIFHLILFGILRILLLSVKKSGYGGGVLNRQKLFVDSPIFKALHCWNPDSMLWKLHQKPKFILSLWVFKIGKNIKNQILWNFFHFQSLI